MKLPEQYFDRLSQPRCYQVAVLGHLNDYHLLSPDPILQTAYTVEILNPKILPVCESDQELVDLLPQFMVQTRNHNSLLRLKQPRVNNVNLMADRFEFNYPETIDFANKDQFQIWGHQETAEFGADDIRSHMLLTSFFNRLATKTTSIRQIMIGQPIKLNYVVYPIRCKDNLVHMFGMFDHFEIKSIHHFNQLTMAKQ